MKVLFDGYWLMEGPPSGRMVALELVRAWSSEFPEDELFAAVPRHKMNSDLSLPNAVRVIPTKLVLHPLINFVELPLIARKLGGVDLYFCQNYSAPSKKAAVFIHDVLFQSNPEWFTRVERIYFSPITILARWAGVVLTSSSSEKRRIADANPSLKRIVTTGLGIPSDYNEGAQGQTVAGLTRGSYVISVGRLNARKNLLRSIEGALRSGVIIPDFPIVIVGEASGKAEDLTEAVQKGVADGRIVFLGYVTNEELLWLYKNAALMTFLSLDEGYGLPPVEAMHLGTKVLASNIPVMHEILGDYADYVDPTDVDAIAACIRAIRSEPPHTRARTRIPSWRDVVRTCRKAVLPGSSRNLRN